MRYLQCIYYLEVDFSILNLIFKTIPVTEFNQITLGNDKLFLYHNNPFSFLYLMSLS